LGCVKQVAWQTAKAKKDLLDAYQWMLSKYVRAMPTVLVGATWVELLCWI
jgi:hypothetical protein